MNIGIGPKKLGSRYDETLLLTSSTRCLAGHHGVDRIIGPGALEPLGLPEMRLLREAAAFEDAHGRQVERVDRRGDAMKGKGTERVGGERTNHLLRIALPPILSADRVADLPQPVVAFDDLEGAIAHEYSVLLALKRELEPAGFARIARGNPIEEFAPLLLREILPALEARDVGVGTHGDKGVEVGRTEAPRDEP